MRVSSNLLLLLLLLLLIVIIRVLVRVIESGIYGK